jgi:hypothetical protein
MDAIEGIGMPSLIGCDRLEIKGPVRFAEGVVVEGKVAFENASTSACEVSAGVYRDTALRLS